MSAVRNPVPASGRHAGLLRGRRQLKIATEAAVPALRPQPPDILFRSIHHGFRPLDGQNVVEDRHLNIVSRQAGDLDADLVMVGMLVNIKPRRPVLLEKSIGPQIRKNPTNRQNCTDRCNRHSRTRGDVGGNLMRPDRVQANRAPYPLLQESTR